MGHPTVRASARVPVPEPPAVTELEELVALAGAPLVLEQDVDEGPPQAE